MDNEKGPVWAFGLAGKTEFACGRQDADLAKRWALTGILVSLAVGLRNFESGRREVEYNDGRRIY